MTTAKSERPWQATVVLFISLFMIIRVSAFSRIGALEPDELFWLYPVTIDILLAFCAPLIVFFLWKRFGLGVWAIAFSFHIIAFQDATVGILFETMLPMTSQGTSLSGVVSLTVIALLSLVALWLLSRKEVRDYYL